jgi:hypothetical protein
MSVVYICAYEESNILKSRRAASSPFLQPLGFVLGGDTEMTQERDKWDGLSQHQQITADKVVHTSNAKHGKGQAVWYGWTPKCTTNRSICNVRFLPAKHNKHGVVPPELYPIDRVGQAAVHILWFCWYHNCVGARFATWTYKRYMCGKQTPFPMYQHVDKRLFRLRSTVLNISVTRWFWFMDICSWKSGGHYWWCPNPV